MAPGIANIRLDLTMKVNEIVQQATTVPGGLYPMVAKAFEIDEYRLLYGWPVPVPRYDIHSNMMVSANGEVITTRDEPASISTNALLRWCSDPDTIDMTSLRWSPVQNRTGQPVYLTAPVFNFPTLVEAYEYRVGSERFYRPALNFDSDNNSYMSLDVTSTIGGASGFSMIFVLSPNSVFGNNLTVPYNGLWHPAPSEDLEPNFFSLTMQGRYLWLATESMERTRTISIAPGLDVSAPLMIGVVFDRPETTIYVGNGPSSIRVFSMPTGAEPKQLVSEWLLGSTGETGRSADMALFDMAIYAERLSSTQMADEFSLLSATYGGDV